MRISNLHEMGLQDRDFTPRALRNAVAEATSAFEKANYALPRYLYLGKIQFSVALGGDSAGWTREGGVGSDLYLGLRPVPVPLTDHIAVS